MSNLVLDSNVIDLARAAVDYILTGESARPDSDQAAAASEIFFHLRVTARKLGDDSPIDQQACRGAHIALTRIRDNDRRRLPKSARAAVIAAQARFEAMLADYWAGAVEEALEIMGGER